MTVERRWDGAEPSIFRDYKFDDNDARDDVWDQEVVNSIWRRASVDRGSAFLASNQALPALDTSHATCCYWRRLLGDRAWYYFTKNNQPDFGLLFLAHFARFRFVLRLKQPYIPTHKPTATCVCSQLQALVSVLKSSKPRKYQVLIFDHPMAKVRCTQAPCSRLRNLPL